MSRTMPTAYWWKDKPNFGDLLTPLLMKRFADTEVLWDSAPDADMVVVGSILEALPVTGWKGIVAGSGAMHGYTDVPARLKNAKVLGVRGPWTAKGLRGNFCLGDPGLLADELVSVDKVYNLGLVPHWSDVHLEHRPEFTKWKPRIIRPSGDPLQVIREIGRCRKIVASSLHGIILADAFGIPRRTEMAAQFSKEGGSFKFQDYNASVGVPFEVGLLQDANQHLVADRQQEIYDMFVALGIMLRKK